VAADGVATLFTVAVGGVRPIRAASIPPMKAKQLGINHWVLDFGGLENLQPGSRVIFTWLQDGST
jgi:hypothetical protein